MMVHWHWSRHSGTGGPAAPWAGWPGCRATAFTVARRRAAAAAAQRRCRSALPPRLAAEWHTGRSDSGPTDSDGGLGWWP